MTTLKATLATKAQVGLTLEDSKFDGLSMSMVISYEDICVPETRKATTVNGQIRSCYAKIGLY